MEEMLHQHKKALIIGGIAIVALIAFVMSKRKGSSNSTDPTYMDAANSNQGSPYTAPIYIGGGGTGLPGGTVTVGPMQPPTAPPTTTILNTPPPSSPPVSSPAPAPNQAPPQPTSAQAPSLVATGPTRATNQQAFQQAITPVNRQTIATTLNTHPGQMIALTGQVGLQNGTTVSTTWYSDLADTKQTARSVGYIDPTNTKQSWQKNYVQGIGWI